MSLNTIQLAFGFLFTLILFFLFEMIYITGLRSTVRVLVACLLQVSCGSVCRRRRVSHFQFRNIVSMIQAIFRIEILYQLCAFFKDIIRIIQRPCMLAYVKS
jgi:hypothetical protein